MRNPFSIQSILLFSLLFFFSVVSKADDSMAPMEKTEQEALYSVIQGFVGKWWNGSELFPDPCGYTPIQGVSCDLFNGLWHITILSIGPVLDNSLECSENAEFSPNLFGFKHLRSLSFFNCFSSPIHHGAPIPSGNWEKLAESLETLEFRSNQGLIGEIPAVLGELASLQSLVLAENGLWGELPMELGNLVHLKRLVLTGNRFSGRIPASLGYNMTELLIIDLSRNSFRGPLPSTLGRLSSLLKLDLSDNLLDGRLPEELENLKNLTLLDLRNNKFSGGLTPSLKGMSSLQELLLSNNPLGGNIKDFEWEYLKNLTTLDLSNVGFKGYIPETIAGLKRLRYLALDNNLLSGRVTSELAILPSIGALYLNKNNFNGELEFPEGFYEKMGRRFAAWGNPNLCYSGELITSNGHVPFGVQQCNPGQEVSIPSSDSNNKAGSGVQGQSSNFSVSLGFPVSSIDGFWWVFLVKEAVVVLLLVLL